MLSPSDASSIFVLTLATWGKQKNFLETTETTSHSKIPLIWFLGKAQTFLTRSCNERKKFSYYSFATNRFIYIKADMALQKALRNEFILVLSNKRREDINIRKIRIFFLAFIELFDSLLRNWIFESGTFSKPFLFPGTVYESYSSTELTLELFWVNINLPRIFSFVWLIFCKLFGLSGSINF